MNDRFRFRHWDKRINKMFYPERNDNFGYYVNNSDIIETMQCTGLKDKNGKLIYEGDIINCFDCRICSRSFPLVEKGIITYKKAQFIVNTKFSEYLFEDIEDIEIIGNIYENRELLEGAEDE